ncbi:hypothetical protein J23TS9_06100 [Paenibacillus sp. J23TS9]|uniref:glycine-rich domain-containing protein n=1 Tax=Paenibacillus sp. J23TS9 TaxID=2807193 RepID=UPI001B26873B|nr:tail fiber protein [Paenibacillus sp. J23TS9]GIP25480.1 hypothetical protein J23TS9_06100 [Paenibacillus sp. J23TS9]
MSSFTKALTNKGLALQAKAQAGVQLKYTKFVIGDGRLTGQSMPALTNIISPKKTVPITKLKMRPPNEAIVGFVLSNQDVATGFFFREMGLFAMDPDEGEILYWYANAGETADYIPPGTNGIVSLLEAENLVVNVGYGATVDDTQAGATNGKCVKFAYATNGNGKAAISGDTLKGLLGNKAGQFKVRARLKVDNTASTVKSFVLCMQNPQTMTPFEQHKGDGVPSDDQVMFSPSELKTDWTWVELPFYWDGVQPVELWTGRPPGLSPGTTIWEDQIQFVGENTSGNSDVIQKSVDILAFVGQATNVSASIDQSLVYVTHPELQEAIDGVKVVIPGATLDKEGIVQLSNATDGVRENVAPTEKALGLVMKEAQEGKQAGIDRKAEVVAALNSIGVMASTSESWTQLLPKIAAVIRATGDATVADVLTGKKFSNANGNGLTGTMPNRGAPALKVGDTLLAGYYSGGKVGTPPVGKQEFSTVGTYNFTIPEGVTRITVVLSGGGGGGGGGYNGTAGGGGGATGGVSIGTLNVVPGQSCSIVVGSGGKGGNGTTGGSAEKGSDGGSSSLSVNGFTITAYGGGGGYPGTYNGGSGNPGTGGSPGSGFSTYGFGVSGGSGGSAPKNNGVGGYGAKHGFGSGGDGGSGDGISIGGSGSSGSSGRVFILY